MSFSPAPFSIPFSFVAPTPHPLCSLPWARALFLHQYTCLHFEAFPPLHQGAKATPQMFFGQQKPLPPRHPHSSLLAFSSASKHHSRPRDSLNRSPYAFLRMPECLPVKHWQTARPNCGTRASNLHNPSSCLRLVAFFRPHVAPRPLSTQTRLYILTVPFFLFSSVFVVPGL
jgi:hypothetical protein